MSQQTEIAMYWWEGFYGFHHLLYRLMQRKKPYVRNFGDLLSPLIVSLLSHRNVCHSISTNKLLALGSIFFALNDKDIVWGSGFLNAKHIRFALACREVRYAAVRGPETRKLLNRHFIDCPFHNVAVLSECLSFRMKVNILMNQHLGKENIKS